ncbi:MAG TPA: hypothetical protein VGQ85_01040, partial [Candidatus Limnocylindrales bacterium]|nr:hypothetical protein [Candidatus Limnocylindrales bacterium]
TLKQRLVRKKNRKLRRLRELYPDIRIKLFYARDFAAMMLKYGRFALVESLSGTIGQMVPDRSGVSAPILGVLPVPVAAPAPLPPAPAGVPVASAKGEPARRSRTAACRLRRRHLRATAVGAGVGSPTTPDGDHHVSEPTSE